MKRLHIAPSSEGQEFRALAEQHNGPLLILDCAQIRHQVAALKKALPDVDFFYAIKSLPHPAVIETLMHQKVGFDVASSGELELLRKHGAKPRRTIHTHPIKRDKDIRAALRFGCTTFVVDNPYEIEKFKPYKSRVALLIRVSFPNPNSPVDLSKKFGAHPKDVLGLLAKAKELGIRVKGLSFHAGSQCPGPENHVHAIESCKTLLQSCEELLGRPLPILDIGGGFPVEYIGDTPDIESFCAPIRKALKKLPSHVQIIAEPGRFISAPAMTSVSRVMGKAKRGDAFWYYLDDGLYGSYSGQLYDHALYPLSVYSDSQDRHPSVIAGPTCDSIDVVAEDVVMPELEIGDIVVGHQMGAYTSASATDFNLFERAIFVVHGEVLKLRQVG